MVNNVLETNFDKKKNEKRKTLSHTECHRQFHHFYRSVHPIERHTNYPVQISFHQYIEEYQPGCPFPMTQSHDHQCLNLFLQMIANKINDDFQTKK